MLLVLCSNEHAAMSILAYIGFFHPCECVCGINPRKCNHMLHFGTNLLSIRVLTRSPTHSKKREALCLPSPAAAKSYRFFCGCLFRSRLLGRTAPCSSPSLPVWHPILEHFLLLRKPGFLPGTLTCRLTPPQKPLHKAGSPYEVTKPGSRRGTMSSRC